MTAERSAPARPLYERVENIRATNGWTKTRLAKVTGLPRTTLERWRDQPRRPLPETVVQVADALGINRDEALTLAGILADATEPPPLDSTVAELRAELRAVQALNAAIERRLTELEGRGQSESA
jgi:transcriptional regulator with XRE-family HTH domain